MKKLLCRDLGGPSHCNEEIAGDSFSEVGEKCKAHVMEQVGGGDEPHKAAIERMKSATPEQQQEWFASYKKKYDDAPEA